MARWSRAGITENHPACVRRWAFLTWSAFHGIYAQAQLQGENQSWAFSESRVTLPEQRFDVLSTPRPSG